VSEVASKESSGGAFGTLIVLLVMSLVANFFSWHAGASAMAKEAVIKGHAEYRLIVSEAGTATTEWQWKPGPKK
jgi:hypothetical protein